MSALLYKHGGDQKHPQCTVSQEKLATLCTAACGQSDAGGGTCFEYVKTLKENSKFHCFIDFFYLHLRCLEAIHLK